MLCFRLSVVGFPMVSSCFVLLGLRTVLAGSHAAALGEDGKSSDRTTCMPTETNGGSPEMMMPRPKRYAGLSGDVRQAVPHGVGRRLGAVGATSLGEDVADVRRHGIEADRQYYRDVGVAATDSDQAQYLELA